MKQEYNPGRQGPNLDPGYKRDRAVTVRLNGAEHQFLKELAKQSNLEVAAYLRQCAFIENVPPVVNIPEINRGAWRALGKTLSNFNQCIRLIHRGMIINGQELLPLILTTKVESEALRDALVGAKEEVEK